MIQDIISFDNYNFFGGSLTSDAGIILFARFISHSSLFGFLEDLPSMSRLSKNVYSPAFIVSQYVVRILLGYFSQSDQTVLKKDPLLFNTSSSASQSTFSRMMNSFSKDDIQFLQDHIQKLTMGYLLEQGYDLLFDADSTLVETCGKQEGASYINHYKTVGYHPLIINEYNSKLLLSSILRKGSSYSSNGIIDALKPIFAYISDDFNRTVIFRGDSAFYDTKLLGFLEQLSFNTRYFIRAKQFTKLEDACIADMDEKGIDYTQYTSNAPYYGELFYSINNTEPRRIIYKAYRYTDEKGQESLFPGLYAVVTNEINMAPRDVMRFYEQRGNSENFTKELKDDFNAGTLSYRSLDTNHMDFLIKAFSYNVYHLFLLKAAKFMSNIQNMRMNTFRIHFLKIAGKVVKHARRIILTMSSAYPNKKEFEKLYSSIQKE